MIQVVFETHSISDDNESGVASGWNHSQLAPRGRKLAVELGRRRHNDGIAAVFCSDLNRAVETARLAFGGDGPPVFLDWRLRECDYGERNGAPTAEDRAAFLDTPYPGGESWRQALSRVGRGLRDLAIRWDEKRVLVIGHVATRWALEHFAEGRTLETLVAADFAWQEGWEYSLEPRAIPLTPEP